MGEWPVDLLVATEVKTFGGHSQRSSVIERDAVYSYQCRGQFEVQVGNQFQRLGPVRAHRVFSNQGTRRLAHQPDDRGRSHLEVIGVMRDDAVKVMFVPKLDPVRCEMLGKCLVYHRSTNSQTLGLFFLKQLYS